MMTAPPFQIEGVQSAALDQPRINANLRRSANGTPLDYDFFGFDFTNVEAFYDTGASGVLISEQTADSFELSHEQGPNGDVIFSDVGVNGSDNFAVSEPLYTSLAPYNPAIDPEDEDEHTQSFGPIRTQIAGAVEEGSAAEGLDVWGIPTMQGKVVVFDPKPVDSFLDTMRTYVYNPGTPFVDGDEDPGIPTTNHHVKLSYGSFDRFTKMTPSNAAPPTLSMNPFIGPNPARLPGAPADNTPDVSVNFNGLSTHGSFLFDTGAVTSMISRATAANVHVRYVAGTYKTANPVLETTSGGSIDNQFTLSIQGVGDEGPQTFAGFFLDSMTIPTTEGEPIEFVGAPVLVADITVANPNNAADTLTLDGIFGMNYLVASAFYSSDGPIIDNLTEGAFNWFTFDQPNGILGLDVKTGPTSLHVSDDQFDYDQETNPFYMQFSRDVGPSLTKSDFVVKNLTTNQTVPTSSLALAYDVTTKTATLTMPDYVTSSGRLPDGNYTVTLAAGNVLDPNDEPMDADYVGQFFQLGGDANHDRSVNLNDFAALTNNFNTPAEAAWADADFNYDEDVNLTDFAVLTNNFNRSLPAPAAKPAALPVARAASSATTASIRERVADSVAHSRFAGGRAVATQSTGASAATTTFSRTPIAAALPAATSRDLIFGLDSLIGDVIA